MIGWLYSLKKQYAGKNIYVWDINRHSIELFGVLAFMKVDIKGFITPEEQYEGQTYMNRPVTLLKQIMQDINNVVVADDGVPEDKFHLKSDRIVRLWDILELNKELKKERIIIYGIGKGADRISELLLKNEIDIDLYCVTQNDRNISKYRGKPIIEAAELNHYRDSAVIISVLKTRYIGEILEVLEGFQGNVYLEHIISRVNALSRNLFQSLDLAIKTKKKVFLYSRRNRLSKLIEDVFSIYGIKVNGYIYDKADEENKIKSIFEVAIQDVENKLIVINEQIPEQLFIARDNIEKAGFSLEKYNYTGVQWYTRAKKMDNGLNRSMYKVYGEEGKEKNIKIMVLGNSCSGELFYIENWVSKLYYKLVSLGIGITIYNGAHSGDDIFQEHLELLGKGYILKPDIVISMSGVNDVGLVGNRELYLNGASYNELDGYCRESSFLNWCRLMKSLKVLAESCVCVGGRVKFFGFLQPMNVVIKCMNLQEKSLFEEEGRLIEDWESIYSVSGNDEYINLMRLFEHQKDMYIDATHYSDKGHEMVARQVFETILPTVQMLNESNK